MIKRKQPSRRRKTKSTQSRRGTFSKRALLLVFIGLVSVSLYLVLKQREYETEYTEDWVKSILIAANVDPERQVQVVHHDGTERWKVSLNSKNKKDAILRALKESSKAQGSIFIEDEAVWREGKSYHIVELNKEKGPLLRLIFVVSKKQPTKKQPTKKHPKKAKPPADTPVDVPVSKKVVVPSKPKSRFIAIILDDIGHEDVETLRSVLELKYPITFAVLPFLSKSKSCAYYLHQNQYEVILHMPMEPESYPRDNPGEGAIFSYHNALEITGALDKALRAVPFVVGVNNHMGSKITANRSLMRPLLNDLKRRNLFYIDSRTQANTVGFKMARELGLRTNRRDVFLDSEKSYEFAIKQLGEACRVADRKGLAIVIGHPYKSSLKALAHQMPKMDKQGYRFVFASSLAHVKQL